MKKLIILLFWICPLLTFAQSKDTTIIIGGDIDKFYPVTIRDMGWNANTAMEVEIGRSVVSEDANWRGVLIAKLRFHVNAWGNGANFIDADIRSISAGATYNDFIAGYLDPTNNNSSGVIIVWLRGGTTTYHLKGNYPLNVVTYVPGPVVIGGTSYAYKTAVEELMNNSGPSIGGRLVVRSIDKSVILGPLGIGTYNPTNSLSFNDVNASELPLGITWYNGGDPTLYGIHRTAGQWVAPDFQQLRLGWRTGIVLDPGTEYPKSYVDIKGKGLRVTAGSVGIGTTVTGEYKLAVEGTIGARKVKVTSGAWADHVFTEAHHRPGLLELEQYINEHKHLPGIPTEAEVKKDGIDVGEMNAKLLEKVEELTLYIIELKKEVEALKKR